MRSCKPFPPEPTAHCVFEHVYFARPDSLVFGRTVLDSRLRLGRQLAIEAPADVDVVCPIPDSGMGAALGFARESGLPFEWGLIRNHYVGRTFIQPRQGQRSVGVKIKLNPVRQVIEGRRVVLIDDSIVRGTTSRKIVHMMREAGAREVHMRISSPPTTGPCYYGIDTPLKSELIASSHSVEEIRRFIEADSLAYLSHEGLLKAVGDDAERRHCTACFSGRYPVAVTVPDESQLRSVREGAGLSAAAMPRLLALGHVSRDRRPGGDVLGGSVTYGALAARKLGWEAAILTSAGPDFEPERELPGIPAFVRRSSATTRFVNEYDAEGTRRQIVTARAEDVDLEALPAAWRDPDALLLGPLVGELGGVGATALEAGCVGAIAQGYVRAIDGDGLVSAGEWARPERDLLGVHVLFLSEHDLPDALARARELLAHVPMIALTRGWRGLTLLTRQGTHEVPSLPRPEVDPTGAGDVFAAAFLVRYQETGDPLEAAAFGACAASCAVEGVGATTLGDRDEVLRRVALRERMIETGDWEE